MGAYNELAEQTLPNVTVANKNGIMNRLFFKYYYDITRINLLVSVLIGLQEFAICFGSAGMLSIKNE